MHHSFSKRFSKSSRIRKRAEFLHLQSTGKKYHARHFVMVFRPSSLASSRLGITVSKRVDKRAVVRNRVKRWIREIYRNHQDQIRSHFDILVIARHNAPECSFRELQAELLSAWQRNGLLSS